MTEHNLYELIETIGPLDEQMMERAKTRWSQVAKPLNSLGFLEQAVVQCAGILRTLDVNLEKKALVIFCSDNGIVEEGVTQTGREVTAAVARNITYGHSCACLMAKRVGAEVFPVDIGVASDLADLGLVCPMTVEKIDYGTKNFSKQPAMTRQQACDAMAVGIGMAKRLQAEGYQMVATGEMGIGNTTTSSAVASVLLGQPVAAMTGKGAGLSGRGLEKKIRVIESALQKYQMDNRDALEILSTVGGFDLAGMTGLFLGGALYRLPVVIDGFISGVAALLAQRLCPRVTEYLLPSHLSAEPAGRQVLHQLGKASVIEAGMCLGEGTGAVAAMGLYQMAADIFLHMDTFTQMEIEAYRPL